MDKGIALHEVRTARKRLGEAGIRASFFVQFGYPGEDWNDILQTIQLLRETLPDDIGISVSYPLPGTKFHSMVVDQLHTDTNWEDSGDLQMLFRGTYTTPLYRELHTVVHDDLDLHRRLASLEYSVRPELPRVSIDEHKKRVERGWQRIEQLRRECRNTRPTLLLRAEAAPPAPTLNADHNYV